LCKCPSGRSRVQRLLSEEECTLRVSRARRSCGKLLSGTGNGGVSAVSSTQTYGFPDWYQDEKTVQLKPCVDPTDAQCVLFPDATFNPALPLKFDSSNSGTNFPGDILLPRGC